MMNNWTPTTVKLPPPHVPIDWISPGGEEVRGKFLGGDIWMPEDSPMYVYYTPVAWRLVEGSA